MDAVVEEQIESARTPAVEQAEVLERVANGVLFLAIAVGALAVFGGVLALLQTDGDTHPDLGLGWTWIGGGMLFGATVALLAVWARTYAAVVRQSQQ